MKQVGEELVCRIDYVVKPIRVERDGVKAAESITNIEWAQSRIYGSCPPLVRSGSGYDAIAEAGLRFPGLRVRSRLRRLADATVEGRVRDG